MLLGITFMSWGTEICSRLVKENLLHHSSDFYHGTFSEHINQWVRIPTPSPYPHYQFVFSGSKGELFLMVINTKWSNKGFQTNHTQSLTNQLTINSQCSKTFAIWLDTTDAIAYDKMVFLSNSNSTNIHSTNICKHLKCARCSGYIRKQNNDLCPPDGDILVEGLGLEGGERNPQQM